MLKEICLLVGIYSIQIFGESTEQEGSNSLEWTKHKEIRERWSVLVNDVLSHIDSSGEAADMASTQTVALGDVTSSTQSNTISSFTPVQTEVINHTTSIIGNEIGKIHHEIMQNATRTLQPVPRIKGILFVTDPAPVAGDTQGHTAEDDRFTKMIALSLGSFVAGALLVVIAMMLVYLLRKRRRQSSTIRSSVIVEANMEEPKASMENVNGSHNSLTLWRSNQNVAEDMQGILSLENETAEDLVDTNPSQDMHLDNPLPYRDIPQEYFQETERIPSHSSVLSSYPGNDPTDNIFVNRFSNFISQLGGDVSCTGSDVVVMFPKSAFRRGNGHAIHVNVSLQPLNTFLHQEYQICPVVEVLSEDVDYLRKPCLIKIPYRTFCGSMDTGPPLDKLRVKYCKTFLENDQWEEIPHSSHKTSRDNASFWCDKNFIYVSSSDLGVFICTMSDTGGSFVDPDKLSFLDPECRGSYVDPDIPDCNMCAICYQRRDKRTPSTYDMCYRIYICDSFADSQKRVADLEKFRGSVPCGCVPITVNSSADILIKVVTQDGQHTAPQNTRAFRPRDILRSCDVTSPLEINVTKPEDSREKVSFVIQQAVPERGFVETVMHTD